MSSRHNLGISLAVLFVLTILPNLNFATSIGGGGTVIYTNTIVANTVYQNTNSIPLQIDGWLGRNTITLGAAETGWVCATATFTTANCLQKANIIDPTNTVNVIRPISITVPPFFYFTINGFGGSVNSFTFTYIGTPNALTIYSNIVAGNIVTTGNINAVTLNGNIVVANTNGIVWSGNVPYINPTAFSGSNGVTINGNTFYFNPSAIDTANGIIRTGNQLQVATSGLVSNTAGVVQCATCGTSSFNPSSTNGIVVSGGNLYWNPTSATNSFPITLNGNMFGISNTPNFITVTSNIVAPSNIVGQINGANSISFSSGTGTTITANLIANNGIANTFITNIIANSVTSITLSGNVQASNVIVTNFITGNVLGTNTFNAGIVQFPNSNSIIWSGNTPYWNPTSINVGTGLTQSSNSISLLPLTSGTGITITSTNNVGMLPLTGINGILVSSTNNIGINVIAPITNTLGTIGCSTCIAGSYVSSLNGDTGAVTLAGAGNLISLSNSGGAGGTITITAEGINGIQVGTTRLLGNVVLTTNGNVWQSLTAQYGNTIIFNALGVNSINNVVGSITLATSGNTLSNSINGQVISFVGDGVNAISVSGKGSLLGNVVIGTNGNIWQSITFQNGNTLIFNALGVNSIYANGNILLGNVVVSSTTIGVNGLYGNTLTFLSSATSYSAGTGIQLSGGIFSLLPLTAGTGIGVSNTNTVSNLGVTSITGSNGFSVTSSNSAVTGYSPIYTSGTGVSISPNNAVNLLPLTGTNGITIASTNNIGIATSGLVSNTAGVIECSACGTSNFNPSTTNSIVVSGGNLYLNPSSLSAGTGIDRTGNVFSMIPLTGVGFVSVSSTNVISVYEPTYTAKNGIIISPSNEIEVNTTGLISNTMDVIQCASCGGSSFTPTDTNSIKWIGTNAYWLPSSLEAITPLNLIGNILICSACSTFTPLSSNSIKISGNQLFFNPNVLIGTNGILINGTTLSVNTLGLVSNTFDVIKCSSCVFGVNQIAIVKKVSVTNTLINQSVTTTINPPSGGSVTVTTTGGKVTTTAPTSAHVVITTTH